MSSGDSQQAAAKPQKQAPKEKAQKEKSQAPKAQPKKAADPGKVLIGLTVKREEDFSEWYTQVLTKAELIDYYEISGCYIFRPWSYQIWEVIQQFFDSEIKKLGVVNAYFPLLVTEAALTKEKDHIEGFAAEVAWVTRSGAEPMQRPVAIRPTSETIMYPAYAKWIKSHRDLPLKINQWNNVIRWEFKHPVPFLRSREFLWQEGHSAFASKEEADVEVLQILDLYRQVYEDLLAIPVTKGFKSEHEKFAGGLYTTTCEAFIPANGRGIQGATSHCLGQNFSKMFDIMFEGEKGQQYVWQNSWGITTRTIGVTIMVHGDNKGLVLPPRVAPIQVVIVTIPKKDLGEKLNDKANELQKVLTAAGIRAKNDNRDSYQPGWKYNDWELKGVPLRIELGGNELNNNCVVLVRRDTGAKETVTNDNLATRAAELLTEIHKNLFNKAKQERDTKIVSINKWEEFTPALNEGNIVLAPWCEAVDCEKGIKKKSQEEAKHLVEEIKSEGGEVKGFGLTAAAKSLCIPFEQTPLGQGAVCFSCGKEGVTKRGMFGRSY